MVGTGKWGVGGRQKGKEETLRALAHLNSTLEDICQQAAGTCEGEADPEKENQKCVCAAETNRGKQLEQSQAREDGTSSWFGFWPLRKRLAV